MLPSLFRQVGTKGCQAIVLQGEYNLELWDDVLRKCILAEDPSGLLRAILLDGKMPEQYKHIQRGDHKWQKANLDCVVFLQATLSTQCLSVVIGMEDASMMYKRLINRYSVDVSNHSTDLMLSLLDIRQQDKQDIQTYLASIDKQYAICRFYDVVPTLGERMRSLIDGLSRTYSTYHDALKEQMDFHLDMVKNGKIKGGEAYEHIVTCILVLHQRQRFEVLTKNESVNLHKVSNEEHKWWQSLSNLVPIPTTSVQQEDKKVEAPLPPPASSVTMNCGKGDGMHQIKEDVKIMEKREIQYEALNDRMDRVLELLETTFISLSQLKSDELRSNSADATKKEWEPQTVNSDSKVIKNEIEKAKINLSKELEKVKKTEIEENTKTEQEQRNAENLLSKSLIRAAKSPNTDIEKSILSSNTDISNNTERKHKDLEEDKALIPSKKIERVEFKETFHNGDSIIIKNDQESSTNLSVSVKGKDIQSRPEEVIKMVKEAFDINIKLAEVFTQGEKSEENNKTESKIDAMPGEMKERTLINPDNQIDHLSLDPEKCASIDQWQKVVHDDVRNAPLSEERLVEHLFGKLKEYQEKESEKDELAEDKHSSKDNGDEPTGESKHVKDINDTKDEEIETYLLESETLD